jgi:hypothetical protein
MGSSTFDRPADHALILQQQSTVLAMLWNRSASSSLRHCGASISTACTCQRHNEGPWAHLRRVFTTSDGWKVALGMFAAKWAMCWPLPEATSRMRGDSMPASANTCLSVLRIGSLFLKSTNFKCSNLFECELCGFEQRHLSAAGCTIRSSSVNCPENEGGIEAACAKRSLRKTKCLFVGVPATTLHAANRCMKNLMAENLKHCLVHARI